MDKKRLQARIRQAIELLESIEVQLSIDGKFPQEKQGHLEKGLCLLCGKPIDGRTIRGCDQACHRKLLRSIETGEFSEEQLISAGLLTEPAKPGPKPSSEIASAVSDAVSKYKSAKRNRPKD